VYLTTVLASLATKGSLHFQPIWLSITLIFMAERVTSVRERGWQQMALAATLVVEMTFDFFLQATQGKALWDTVTHNERKW
jgi:hypothetical protein